MALNKLRFQIYLQTRSFNVFENAHVNSLIQCPIRLEWNMPLKMPTGLRIEQTKSPHFVGFYTQVYKA